jgi:hypothetical protein
VNLPLASANRISADADVPSYSSTLRIGLKMCACLEILDLGIHIEDEMPTRLPSHKGLTTSSLQAPPRKCIARPQLSMIIPKSFPQHDDTANMQCKLCASYFQYAPSNLASYPRSLPDISPNPSSSIQYPKV